MKVPAYWLVLACFVVVVSAVDAAAPTRAAICRLVPGTTDTTLGNILANGDVQAGFTPITDATKPAQANTSFQVAWSEQALWVVVTCPLDGRSAWRAPERPRDGDIWFDDAIELFVQPMHDDKYYHFGWTAADVKFDEIGMDRSWDADWTLVNEMTADAWRSLVVIPFAALGSTPETSSVWRFNVCRDDPAAREYSSWSNSGGGFHDRDRFGWLFFAGPLDDPNATGGDWMTRTMRQLQPLLFDQADLADARAAIRELLGQPDLPDAPVLTQLTTELGQLATQLSDVERRFAAPDASQFAALVDLGGRVPVLTEKARETVCRWRIEELFLRHEAR